MSNVWVGLAYIYIELSISNVFFFIFLKPNTDIRPVSGIATGGGGGGGGVRGVSRGKSATPDSEKFAKNQEKQGENWEKEEKLGRKGKNWKGSFTLPLLTDRAGYASEAYG